MAKCQHALKKLECAANGGCDAVVKDNDGANTHRESKSLREIVDLVQKSMKSNREAAIRLLGIPAYTGSSNRKLSASCQAARNEGQNAIHRGNLDIAAMVIAMIDGGCFDAEKEFSDTVKSEIAAVLVSIREHASGSTSVSAEPLNERIDNILANGLAEEIHMSDVATALLAMWMTKARYLVSALVQFFTVHKNLEKLETSLLDSIEKVDRVAEGVLSVIDNHVRTHLLTKGAQQAATATDAALVVTQVVVGIGVAADTGEWVQQILKGLQGTAATGLNQFLSGTLHEKVESAKNAALSAPSTVASVTSEVFDVTKAAYLEAKEKLSDAMKSEWELKEKETLLALARSKEMGAKST